MYELDLSKTLLYDFHQNYTKKKYVHKAKLFFTDTDSLMYEIETNGVYKDFHNSKEKSDFSQYLLNSKFHNSEKKLGQLLSIFVSMYSYKKM